MEISGICLSSREKEDSNHVSRLIKQCSPQTKIFNFLDVLDDISILEECDFIFPIGGDGSVAWLVGTYFQTYGANELDKLKPIVPVIRPESVGYMKQIDYEEEKFKIGFQKLLDDDFYNLDRTVLSTNIKGKEYLAVNEINIHTAPNLGMFSIYIETNNEFHKISDTMADGVLVATAIGSTGWGLSYDGHISLSEDALELIFVGGVHSSANFQLPRKSIKISLNLKNSPIATDSVRAYQEARKRQMMSEDDDAQKTLQLVYGPRIIIDGKIISFDTRNVEIRSDLSVPFSILSKETYMDKARKLTTAQDVKY